jgi:hypothetical protein
MAAWTGSIRNTSDPHRTKSHSQRGIATCSCCFLRRFGFANSEALASGETGTACRGEEHDVTLVWSIASGKRLILVDGHEVHYSSSRNAIFDFSWTMRGNHVLKMVAHVSPPLSPTPGFRQYDFFIDGQSFFTFPKVFRLGLAPGQAPASPSGASTSYAGMAPTSARRSASGEIVSMEAPHNPDEVRLTRCPGFW